MNVFSIDCDDFMAVYLSLKLNQVIYIKYVFTVFYVSHCNKVTFKKETNYNKTFENIF